LAGAITALLVTGGVFGILNIAKGFDKFGSPRVMTDDVVRTQIEGRGVELPASAGKLYYSIAGFVDQTEFIAFTTAPTDVMQSAISFAQQATNVPVFKSGSKSEYSFINDGPKGWGPEWATPLWDISSVKNGQMFEIRHMFILVDTDNSRVYISMWNE
jgi:uncharacterized protein with LGFP repeats